jgi:hypothetical protein
MLSICRNHLVLTIRLQPERACSFRCLLGRSGGTTGPPDTGHSWPSGYAALPKYDLLHTSQWSDREPVTPVAGT